MELRNRFHILQSSNIDEEQIEEKDTFTIASERVIGFRRQVHKEWITPDIWKLIDNRKELKKKMCNTHSERIKKKRRDQYSNINREVKKATKMDRKNFIKNMANEAEEADSEQRMCDVYQITKKLC